MAGFSPSRIEPLSPNQEKTFDDSSRGKREKPPAPQPSPGPMPPLDADNEPSHQLDERA
jgi:hypothetical protein